MIIALQNPSEYGPLTDLVSGAGSLIAAAGAIAMGWRRRAKWEPSEQDIDRGPQRVGSLINAIAIAILWTQARNPTYLPQLRNAAIILGIITIVSLLVYGFMVNTFTYQRVVAEGNAKARIEKIIGGLWRTSEAKQFMRSKAAAGELITTQDLLKGREYDPDKVWNRGSRGLAKVIFVLCYLGLTASGTIALACASIILGFRYG